MMKRNYKNIIDSISDADIQKMNNNIEKYNEIILTKIVFHKYITYNSIITLVIELFKRYPILLKQYQNLFELIIVDEYQDTNLLGYILLKMLITDKTRLLFLEIRCKEYMDLLVLFPILWTLQRKNLI